MACQNRVIQRGPKFRLELFKTWNGRGWGVRASEAIPKGRFVCEYVGELVSSEQAEERGKVYDREACSYLFDLDLDPEIAHKCYVIDAKAFGGASRFFNHSCNPNLDKYFFWIDHLDTNFPRVAFFTRRDIKAGEELTFDYQYRKKRGRAHKNTIMCKCGDPDCKKVLF